MAPIIDTDAPADEEPRDDLRAELSTALADFDSGSESPAASQPQEPEAGEVSSSSSSATPSGDRQRGPDGKFLAKAADAPANPEIPSKDTAKPSPDPASTPVAATAPAGWTADEKALFPTLPPAVQAAVSRREAEMQRGGQQWSEQRRHYEAVLAPVAQAASRRGMSAEQGIQALMVAQDFLDRDAPNAIRSLAQQYGVNLATLAGQPADGSPDQNQSPDISALVRQAVQPFIAPLQERFRAEDMQRENATTQQVIDFAASPGHEHFDAVSAEIMSMIPLIKERNPTMPADKVLQMAYDNAVYANPQTRGALLSARETAAEEKRRQEAKQRANGARNAAVSVTGSPTGSPAPAVHDSLRAELEAAWSGST